jgi:cytochrome c oxidase assembly factor CtaG/putative copper export protein
MTGTVPRPSVDREPEGAAAVVGAGVERARSLLVVAASLAAALVAVLAGLVFTNAAAPFLLYDPGPVVRWGLPVVTVIARLAGALTIGLLVLAAVALPVETVIEGPRAPSLRDGAGRAEAAGDEAAGDEAGLAPSGRRRTLAFAPAMQLTAIASGVWTLAMIAQTILSYGSTSGTLLTDPRFGQQLVAFVQGTEPGRGLLVTTAVAALITMVAAGSRTIGTAGFLATLALVIALTPPALAGHSASLDDHETAVTSTWLHLIGISVWVGGLAALVLLRRALGERLPAAVAVYSTLAAWAFGTVAVSGVLSSWIRLQSLADLTSDYGILVTLKIVALVVLGLAGALHRRRALPDLHASVPGTFARLAAVEAVVMGVAVGIAEAMAVSAPPSESAPRLPTLAESLTGYPMPPPVSLSRMVTQWQPDLMWVALGVLGAALYAVGIRRLHAWGEHWPVGLAVSWFIGLAGMVYVTSGAPMAYGRVLFSAHMAAHMSLSMLVPIFLVLGAPITLALRTLPGRDDGSRGPREWLVAVLESRFIRIVSFPPMAGFLFAGSLVFFYFSPLFELALRTHIGHELMHIHFLASGYLFSWVLIGLDPGPRRVGHPLRLITLVGSMTFHSFFGVSLLSAKNVLAADFFGGLGRTWGPELASDQRFGAGIAWGIGDIPILIMAVAIAVQWSRADDREARRKDAAADLDDDAELRAYNEMLARMAEHDARQVERENRPS